MDNNKKVYLVIAIISIIMLAMGVTTAWFTWRSSINTDVTFNVEGLDITYTGDANILNKKLYPTASMTNTDNIIHNFSLVTTSNIDIYTKISLDIIKLDDNLKDVSFRWDLYKENTSIASGDISSATVGSDLLLTPYEKITTTPTNYTLYIWIDGEHYNNPLAMGGKEFYFKLKLDAGQQDYTTQSDCFTFDETTGTITGYLCTKGNSNNLPELTEIVIPRTINNKEVTILKSSIFRNKGLTKVVLPTTLKTIEDGCFAINNLKEIIIPDGVTKIGGTSFWGNSLEKVSIPSTVLSIGGQAFNKNNLPEEYAYIYARKDENKDGIAEIDYTQIVSYGGTNTNIVIPNTVKTIGTQAFYSTNINTITIPEGVTNLGYASLANNNLTSITLPESITNIDTLALANNKLTTVTIPKNVKAIGTLAFEGNILTSIYLSKDISKDLRINTKSFIANATNNPNLQVIYNLANISLDWNLAITGTYGTAFVSGTVTTSDGRTITITTSE